MPRAAPSTPTSTTSTDRTGCGCFVAFGLLVTHGGRRPCRRLALLQSSPRPRELSVVSLALGRAVVPPSSSSCSGRAWGRSSPAPAYCAVAAPQHALARPSPSLPSPAAMLCLAPLTPLRRPPTQPHAPRPSRSPALPPAARAHPTPPFFPPRLTLPRPGVPCRCCLPPLPMQPPASTAAEPAPIVAWPRARLRPPALPPPYFACPQPLLLTVAAGAIGS
nr:vegetative cell wall protein gp1 [Aegilops tauschii subsp. strangulata]